MANNISAQSLLLRAELCLRNKSPTVRLDVELLLLTVLSESPALPTAMLPSRGWLYAHPDTLLSNAQCNKFWELVDLRHQGHPIAYLLGQKEFWGLSLQVDQHTLIPRPETELLVDMVLKQLPPDKPCCIADLGTGSGAIAIALAKERPRWQIIATDISHAALQITNRNIQSFQLTNVTCRQGDWFAALLDINQAAIDIPHFDAIVSNPPYIAPDEPCLQSGDLRFEPKQALLAGDNGLQYLRLIIMQAKHHLLPSGWLWLEHGYQQAEAVKALMLEESYQNYKLHVDLAGHPRVSGAQNDGTIANQ